MTAKALHSKASVEWGTPPEIVELARQVLDRIDVDPCSSEYWNRHTVKAGIYYTKTSDVLNRPPEYWRKIYGGHSFMINPPGGFVDTFFEFAFSRWRAECPVFWVGFSVEQLTYLQVRGIMHRDIVRAVLPKRIAYLQRRTDAIARIEALIVRAYADCEARVPTQSEMRLLAECREDPEGPPVVGPSPTHGSYLALLPTTLRQARLFRAGVEAMGAVPF